MCYLYVMQHEMCVLTNLTVYDFTEKFEASKQVHMQPLYLVIACHMCLQCRHLGHQALGGHQHDLRTTSPRLPQKVRKI